MPTEQISPEENTSITSLSKPSLKLVWPLTLFANALECSKIFFFRSCKRKQIVQQLSFANSILSVLFFNRKRVQEKG
jgi:hypothetical protein